MFGILLHFQLGSWIIVFGGCGAQTCNNLTTFFNWMTLEMCSLPALPYMVSGHAATTGFGFPFFCGGRNTVLTSQYMVTCYKFNPITKGWTQVLNLSFLFISDYVKVYSEKQFCLCLLSYNVCTSTGCYGAVYSN